MISIDSFHDGGAEMFAIRLANGLVNNYEVHFMEYSASGSKNKAQKKQVDNRIKMFSPEESFFLKILFQIKKFMPGFIEKYVIYFISCCRYISIRKYIIKNNIETVNSHAIEHNSILVRVKRQLPYLNLVLSLHGHYELYRGNFKALNIIALINNHISGFNKIIYTTQDQINTFTEFGLESTKAKKIFYGIDYNTNNEPLKLFQSGNILELILVSRAIVEKGWVEAIQAVELINKNGLKVSLLLVGEGPILNDLKNKNQHEFIKFAGNVENVFSLIREAHIGLLPTYYHAESLPNSVIEYLSCGKPVIASNIGAIADMLSYEGELAGELITTERGNPVNIYHLQKMIMNFLDNPELYNLKVKLAFKAAEKFKLSTCIHEYSSIL